MTLFAAGVFSPSRQQTTDTFSHSNATDGRTAAPADPDSASGQRELGRHPADPTNGGVDWVPKTTHTGIQQTRRYPEKLRQTNHNLGHISV